MDRKTYDALQASIAHWRLNAGANSPFPVNIYGDDCALCALHFDADAMEPCDGCPVSLAVEQQCCVGTPWKRVRDALLDWRAMPLVDHYRDRFRIEAKSMLQFLQALVPAGGTDDGEAPSA